MKHVSYRTTKKLLQQLCALQQLFISLISAFCRSSSFLSCAHHIVEPVHQLHREVLQSGLGLPVRLSRLRSLRPGLWRLFGLRLRPRTLRCRWFRLRGRMCRNRHRPHSFGTLPSWLPVSCVWDWLPASLEPEASVDEPELPHPANSAAASAAARIKLT